MVKFFLHLFVYLLNCRDYESELFAFGKRIGEEFNEATIRTAFTDISHVQRVDDTEMKSKAEDVRLPAEHNQLLAQIGKYKSGSALEIRILKGSHFKAILRGQHRSPRSLHVKE